MPGSDRIGSSRRVFCSPRNTGSVRSSVPRPRSLNLTSGRPGSSSGFGMPIFGALSPAPLEHAQDIAGLRHFPSAQRIQMRQHALRAGRDPATAADSCSTRCATPSGRVAFTKTRVFVGKSAVVVESRLPKHGAGGHHAGAHREHFLGVTTGGATGLFGTTRRSPGLTNWMYSLVSLSHSVKGRTGLAEVRHSSGMARLGMRLLLSFVVAGGAFLRASGRHHIGVATVAIGAAQANRSGGVHRRGIGLAVAGDATDAIAVGLFLRLPEARLVGLLTEQESAEKRTSAADTESNCDAASGHRAFGRFISLFSNRLMRLASRSQNIFRR